MTISFTKWSVLVFLFWPLFFHGQDNLTAYWQPQLAVNYPVSKSYSHNFATVYRGFIVDAGDVEFRSRQIDITHFSKFSLQDNQSVSLGVQYRFRDVFENKSDELRLTQQFNSTQRPMVVRFGHRLRTEQRILEDLTIHRFRYRFALDFPLKGEKLDTGEPFLVTSIEQLLSVSKASSSQYDWRINGQLGWKLEKGIKLLFGIEYRLEDYSSSTPQNVLFLLTRTQLAL